MEGSRLVGRRENQLLQVRVSGGVPDHYFEVAGFTAVFHAHVVERQGFTLDIQRDCLRFTRLKPDLFKPFQLLYRPRD